MYNTPQLNATGIYEVKLPFTLEEGAIYRCEALSRFEPLIADGVDVFETYYAPHGLSQTVYESDLTNAVSIVTITATADGSSFDIPSSYILSFPSAGVVAYGHLVMSIDLGLLPDYVPLDELRAQIADYASDVIGVRPKTNLHRLPLRYAVTVEQHQLLELNREVSIKGRKSTYAENERLLALREKDQERITLLEETLASLTGNTQ